MKNFSQRVANICLAAAACFGTGFASAQVSFPNGTPEAPVVDLRVKVLGGQVTVDRQWWEGQWRVNLRWAPAEWAGSPSGTDGCLAYPEVKVQGRSYRGDGQAWLLENRYSVRAIGYFDGSECLANRTKKLKWQDRITGKWMEYERVDAGTLQFRLARYGDRNDVTVNLAYDAAGQLAEVRDHFNTPVLQYVYTGGQVTEIRDVPTPDDPSPARAVKYTWGQSTVNGQAVPVITQVTDVLGNLTRYGITAGKLETITDAEGRVRTYAYTADRVTSYTNPEGKITSYVYDYNKLKKEFYVRMGPPIGAVVESWHDGDGGLIRHDVDGKTAYQRGQTDTVTRTEVRIDVQGGQTKTTRDEYGNIVKNVYPDGSSTSAVYSAVHGQMTEKTDELGVKTRYDYDAKGNLVRKTEALGLPEERITEYEVDVYGQVTKTTRKGRTESNGAVTPDATWQFVLDLKGNVTQSIDPEGKIRRYTYDRRGNELTATDPLGQVWRSAYDAADQVIRDTDPLGHATSYAYDKVGNLTAATDPLGKIWRTTYDSQNRPLKRIDPLGNEYTTQYNAAGKLAQVIDASGKRMQLDYDAQQRLSKATDGKGQVYQFDYSAPDGSAQATDALAKLIYPTFTRQFRFDARGRPQQRTDLDGAEGRVNSYTHDAAGRQKTITDANGKTRYYDYDGFGNLVQAKDPMGNAMRLLRDTRGNVIAVTDPRSNTTKLAYDRRNLLIESTDPLANTTRYGYDDNGRLTEIRQANGQKVAYVYDDAGRMTEHREYSAAGTLQKTTTYSYDDADNLIAWNDGTVSAARSYDDAGRLKAETVNYGAFALTHRYTWHGNNQLASYTGPDNLTVTYDYDAQGQLQNLAIPGEGSLSVTDWHWFAPRKVLLPGGTEQRMEYDGYVDLKQLKVVSPAQAVLFDLQNQYGKLAELKTTSRDGTTLDYTYDDAQRLTAIDGGIFSGKNETFQVDAAGNRTLHSRAGSDAWSYDAANQLTGRGPVSYQYDASGNQVKKVDTRLQEPARTTNYAYDAFNRLTEVTDGAGQLIARYTYDPFDRRLSKTLGVGATGLAAGTTWYLLNDWGLLAETDAAGNLQAVYGWHPSRENGTGPVYARMPDGAGGLRTVYYHNDQLGTPQRVTDKGGNLVWAADYDGFGRASVREIGPEGIINNLRYPGQYFDAETGLHYNDRRVYDPDTGRYITRDPIGFEGGINLYAYAGHSPSNFADPTGEFFPACILVNYLRCMATCTVLSTVSDYFLNCQNIQWGDNLKECAIDCLLSLLPIPDPCGKFGQAFSAAVGALGALNSFPGETLVHVKPAGATPEDARQAKAVLKPIREIAIGDEVLALAEWKEVGSEPESDARLSYEKVVDIFTSTRSRQILRLLLNNGEILETTTGHPFRTPNGWRDAVLLKEGDQLVLKGGNKEEGVRAVVITDVSREERTLQVYNLEIANAHTFFVGKEGALVHNPEPPPGWNKTNERSHGQPVYNKGNLFITPDVDRHNGGVWKMCRGSPRNLRNKTTRMGTYNADLSVRIGD